MPHGSAVADPNPNQGEHPVRWRRELRSFGELFALSGLAITQPILDVFGRAPDHFIFRGADRREIILFGLLITLVPAVAAHLLEVSVGLVSSRHRPIAHLGLLGVLATVFLTLALDGLLIRTGAIIAALAITSIVLLLYQRTRGVRIWLAFLSPAPIAFLALFLTASPAATLLRADARAHDVRIDDPRRTVILLLDEFPLSTLLDENGDVDRDLFPNFARLADSSVWFRQATTVSNTTVRAVPTLLTGVIPEGEGSPTSTTYPDNLFTLVGGSMPVTSSEVLTRMCPTTVCDPSTSTSGGSGGLGALLRDAGAILRQRLSPTDPDVDPLSSQIESDPGAAEPTEGPAPAEGAGEHRDGGEDGGLARYERFLDRLADGTPGLHYFHLLQPHRPHRHLPDGRTYNAPSPALGRFLESWVDTPEPVMAAHQQYLLQLRWTDELLGDLIDTLHDAGTWDDTNLIVLADHGFGYEPGGPVRAMAEDNDRDDTAIAEILWIPFFVKAAEHDGPEISDDPVRIVDLLPTVADLLDVDVPWEIDGRSVFDGGSGDPDEVGMYRSIAGRSHADSPHRTLERDRGHRLLMERTTGILAPSTADISGTDRIFAIGPRPDLYGRPVPDSAREVTADIDADSRTDHVDRNRPPIVFRARVPDLEAGRNVAIAVDGTVRATARVHTDDGSRIIALLPPEVFDEPITTVTVHLLDRP